MRKKYFLIIFFGTLACMLLLDDLVFQPLVSQDSNLVYALGRHPRPSRGTSNPDPAPPSPVPEPSTLLLVGSGIAGMGSYLYYRQ